MKKIIVVDPDKAFWQKVEKVVNTDICEVFFLENGNSLISKLKSETFDLIILNLELPDKNGFIFCNQIKKDPQLKEIPVIITSSEKTEQDFEQHKKLKVRAQEYLRKPIELETLKKAIEKFLPDIIYREKKQAKKQESIGVDDFNEENIDKLLDETFTGLMEEDKKESKQPAPPKEDTSKLQQQLDAVIEENLALKQQIEEFKKGISAEDSLKKENQELKQKIEDLNKEIDELKAKLNQRKEELKELNVQLIALQKEKGFLEKENRDHLMNITSIKADFEEKFEDQKKTIDMLTQEKEQLDNKLNEAKKELEEKDKFIATLQEEVSRLKDKVDTYSSKIQKLEQENEQLSNFKAQAEKQIIDLNNMVSSLQKEINISKEAKSALEETIFQLKEDNRDLQSQIEKKDRENKLFNDRLKKAEGEITRLKEKLNKIKLIASE